MKIINTHTHLIEKDKFLSEDNQEYLQYIKDIPTFERADDVLKMLSVETLLKQMEEANVSQSVLFAVHAPILYSSNEYVADLCKQFPEKFIGFASVDIKQKNAPEILENAIIKFNLKGLKLHPPLQDFNPNNKKIFPLYRKAQELNIPVVFHIGSTPFGHMVKLSRANPILIDDIANEFPELKIILTHLGTLWHNEAFMITEKHPNVYIDTAAYPYEIKEIMNEKMIIRIGAKKFIFGTDYPMPYEGKLHELKDFVNIIDELTISKELKERIFHQNFEELMNS